MAEPTTRSYAEELDEAAEANADATTADACSCCDARDAAIFDFQRGADWERKRIVADILRWADDLDEQSLRWACERIEREAGGGS